MRCTLAAALVGLLATAATGQPYASPANPVEDVAGWDATRWGMNADDLAAALGPRLVLTRNQIGLVNYTVAEGTIGGVTFTPVQLTLSPGRGLTEVRLGTGWVNHERADQANAIENALRLAYGAPLSVQTSEEPGPDGMRATSRNVGWNFPTTTIQFRHWLATSPEGVQDLISISFLRTR